jgi:ankyrin repeat protein
MLRSFIYQIVMARGKLLKIVKRVMEEQDQLTTDIGALWRLFNTLATHQRVGSLILIVDAIDECLQDGQEWFVQHLDEFVHLNSSPIRVFITGRPNCPAANALKISSTSTSYLDLETRQSELEKDVDVFIQEHTKRLVRNGRCTEETRVMLEGILQHKAEGSFLWVSLALPLLRARRFLKKSDLTVAQNLPSDLKRMYQSLMEAIPEDERLLASKTMCAIATCQRNLTIQEMNAMLAIDASHRSVADIDDDEVFSHTQQVESLLSGLVRTSGNHIALIHHTLKEYLVECQSDETAVRDHRLVGDIGVSHHLVAECCMRYLILREFEQDVFSNSTPQSPTISEDPGLGVIDPNASSESDRSLNMLFMESEETTENSAVSIGIRYKLYDYAARFWASHFLEIQHDLPDELQNLALSVYEATNSRNWFKYVSILDNEYSEYPVNPDSLTLACFYGHDSMVHALLLSHDDDACSPALYWAASNGHVPCVRALLSEKPSRQCWSDVRGRSSLAIAAARGHTTCVEEILLRGTFDVNVTDPNSRTPLSLAAGGAHFETVCKLLVDAKVDVNLPDRSRATPIFWAVCVNSSPVVQRLLKDKRTRLDCLDRRRRTALSWACEYGFIDLVRLLARSQHAETDQADARGRTPLIYAAMFGHLEVVKYLVQRGGIDLSHQDSEGRNAVSWAAQQSKVCVLEYLLEKNPLGAQIQDVHGWNPFAWTLDPPERRANARALMSHDPEASYHNGSGLGMFELAISWRSYSITSLLISYKAFPINETSLEGRTAMSYAAEVGHVGLVRQLLATKDIDIKIADPQGRTPYSFAAAGHHDEVCRLLQENL